MFSRPQNHSKFCTFSKGFALNATFSEPKFGREERWLRSFLVGGYVRLQYGLIVHYNNFIKSYGTGTREHHSFFIALDH